MEFSLLSSFKWKFNYFVPVFIVKNKATFLSLTYKCNCLSFLPNKFIMHAFVTFCIGEGDNYLTILGPDLYLISSMLSLFNLLSIALFRLAYLINFVFILWFSIVSWLRKTPSLLSKSICIKPVFKKRIINFYFWV